jgi:hypothetical protein
VAWDDPAPARAARAPAAVRPAPGYGAVERRGFGALLGLALVALLAGACAYAAAHAGVEAWHEAHGAALWPLGDRGLALAAAALLALWTFRHLLRRPRIGLPRRIRDGGGGYGWRRGWDDDRYGDAYSSLGEQLTADAVADVVGAVIEAVADSD